MSAPPDGVLVVDKGQGPTSHDVVAVARRALATSRVGHTGTLDPMATGVLVLVAGRATRLARFMTHDVKAYVAQVTFGRSTTTYDAEGEVTRDTGRVPDHATLAALVTTMGGPQLQTPPAYSAKKVGGEVAHKAARRDAPLALAPVPVTVHALTLDAYDNGIATLTMTVSAGFYVRALAHALGETLGTGAHLSGLRRTRAGAFGLDAIDRMLPEYPAAHLTAESAAKVRHGQSVQATITGDGTGPVRLLDEGGHLIAMAETAGAVDVGARRILQPVVVLG